MTNKGIIASVPKTVVAAGKSVAEEAKAFAGEVVDAAGAATATAKAATTAAAGAVLHKVSMIIEASKPTITNVQETVAAAGKSVAKEAKAFAGEVADAAAAARTATTGAAGAVLDTVAGAIEARTVKGAKAADEAKIIGEATGLNQLCRLPANRMPRRFGHGLRSRLWYACSHAPAFCSRARIIEFQYLFQLVGGGCIYSREQNHPSVAYFLLPEPKQLN